MTALRKEIIERLNAYLASIPKISAKSPETVEYTRSFLTEGYENRLGDVPYIMPRDVLLSLLAEESDTQWTTHVEVVYWIIDEVAQKASACINEELRDPQTGELMRCVSMFTHMDLETTNDNIRIAREHMVEIPSKFRMDKIPSGAK